MKRVWFIAMLLVASMLEAETMEYTIYAKVKKSIPEYERVIEQEPYEECWSEHVPVTYYEEQTTRYSHGDPTAAAVIGGVAGGVLGHQLIHGKSRDAATIGGAILGTLVGQNAVRRPNMRPAPQAYTRYETRQHCTTRYREHAVKEIRRYKNIAYYRGKKIVKYSDRPLKRIPLYITVSY
jgi:uncharacterized protein YcfJ